MTPPLDRYAKSILDVEPERVAATRRLAARMFSIFRGREDAYSTQHLRKDGDKVYYPACGAKGHEGCLVGKKKSPCDECSVRQLLPFTEDVMVRHLRGEIVVGLYLIAEKRVHVAAVDFDDHGTAPAPSLEEAPLVRGGRVVEAARELGIIAFLERSGGGKGAHVWVFFRDWVSTGQARSLMELLLRRAGIPVTKALEIFPRQRDARKFGNLLALPYQRGPEHWPHGSAFLDHDTLELRDPEEVMDAIEGAVLSDIEVQRIRRENAVPDVDDLPRPRAPVEPEVAALTDDPVAAIFSSCAALRAIRDEPPDPTSRHGRLHIARLALASILRDLPGGREAIHEVVRKHCADYDAQKTDSQIESLSCPPMLCETLQAAGLCTEPCAAIRERNNKSPVAFAYRRLTTEDGKVEIRVTTDEKQMYDAALAALRSHPDLYQRGGLLVAVVSTELARRRLGREPEAPRIELIPRAWIERDLTDVVRFLKYKNHQGWVATDPPRTLVEQFYTPRYLTGLRDLRGLTESPQMRSDGSVISTAGYDAATGLFYRPFCSVPDPPATPTRADALQARDELLECVEDFPFESEHGRAAWLSLVLTYFARPAIEGSLPLFVVDANIRGAGKSLLAQLAAIIMTGREAATMGWNREETENKKVLTSLFITGEPVILFDNVDCKLGGAALNAALTSTTWNDRILGESRNTGRMPISALFMATSNNATFGDDTVRRVVHIRLNSPHEHPEDRDDLKIPKVRQWVRENRPRLVRGALTILRAFAAAGTEVKLPPMAEYIEWSARVRAPIVWLGMQDPLMTQKILAMHADNDANELAALMDAMQDAAPGGGWATAATLLSRAEQGEPGIASREAWDGRALRDVLLEHCPGKGPGGLPTAKVFAGRLVHFRNRFAGKMAIVSRPGSGHVTEWRVERSNAEAVDDLA